MAEGTAQPAFADNEAVARVLSRTADLLEFNEENFFKVRSYRTAAEVILEMRGSISELVSEAGVAALRGLPGVGKSISGQILEILETGTSQFFEELKEQTPETVLELLTVPGIGIKTARTLHGLFGISSLADLRAFIEGGGLASVPGLGEKMAKRIQNAVLSS